MKKKIRRAGLAVFCGLFLVFGFLLVRDLVRSAREKATNDALAGQVHELRGETGQSGASGEKTELSPYAESGLLRQYDPLYRQNSDFAGWLWIEGTSIDYPVMYTPQEPEKYLHRDFYGKWAAGGCLFFGEGSGPDDAFVMVFGHHMKDGSMFSDLDEYTSADYAKEHPIIRLDTLTEEREYEVIAAFRSRVYEVDEQDVFRYYEHADLSEPEAFERYLGQVYDAALYDTGVTAQFGDRILLLSTCSYHTENGRFAVVARQKAGDE